MKKKSIWIVLPLVAILAIAAGPVRDKYFEITKNIEIYTNVYKELNTHYVDELDPGQLMRTGIDAMVNSLDPYTNYISESQIEDYRIFTEARYNGIGVEIRLMEDKVVLDEVYEGFPAQKAGLRTGDQLISINGRPLKADDANVTYRMMRGTPGSSVVLEYIRPGNKEVKRVEMTREEVDIPNVPYYRSLDDGVAYIKLSNFTANATKNIAEAFKKLKAENKGQLNGLVLDLRGNPGGLLREAVNIVNLFVPKDELIVSTRGKSPEHERVYRTMGPAMDTNIPVVILINKNSASASEIVSGALQDLDRGVVMGQLSYGKGLVQNTHEVGYNSRLKVTISKYYIPSGRCIQSVRYENGEPVPLPDSLRQPFRTKNGRTVYDGGGVMPDIKLTHEEQHPLIKQLTDEGWILRYIDDFCEGKDSLDQGLDFCFTDYPDFLSFLKKKDFQYEGPVDKQLKELKKAMEKEGYEKEMAATIKDLETRVEEEQEALFTDYEDQLTRLITREIIERYYYNTGIIVYELGSDEEVNAAKELLLDQDRYNKVLKTKKK